MWRVSLLQYGEFHYYHVESLYHCFKGICANKWRVSLLPCGDLLYYHVASLYHSVVPAM